MVIDTGRRRAVPLADPFSMVPAGSLIAAAMSGGVDSSVATALAVTRGFAVVGITLAMWPRNREIERDRGCCSIDAVDDARRVAARLGIRHYAWDLEVDFHDLVITAFEAEYAAGRTPNPCVRCNETIKFGALLERARAIGATHVLTGHYARRGWDGERWTLHRGAEARKDQAYTLHRLDQAQLSAAVLPLGGYADKASVRAEAARLGLATAAKPDSQELCFVDGTIGDELRRRLIGRFKPGPITHLDGRVMGVHEGLPFYTVGQRGRLGIAADRPMMAPLYVVDIDESRNTIVVGPAEALLRRTIDIDDCRWITGGFPGNPVADMAHEFSGGGGRPDHDHGGGAESVHSVQVRAHGVAHPVRVVRLGRHRARLHCDPAIPQVSPGQAAVIYRDDEVLGGGTVVGAI